MKRPSQKSPTNGRGSVRADELLLLSEASRRLGWGVKTARRAQREGLRVVPFGRALYVTGRDLIDFFQRRGDTQAAEGER